MDSNVKLSTMTLSDLNNISDILLNEFDDFWSISILKNELQNENSYYIAAKINSEIVGFGGIWKACDEVHITNIVIKKGFRKKGIGSLILNKLINIGKDLNFVSITLEVNENNIPAKNLYSKYGFKQVGLRKKYYNNIDNAIIMTLTYEKNY